MAVIPAHDEADRIAPVVVGVIAHVPALVVDDGSMDGTAAVAEAAGATVLRQEPNQGKGAALRTGFRRAVTDGAQAVFTLDADGQHDPAEIPEFVGAWAAAEPGTFDLIVGRRNFRAMPPSRRLANELGRRAVSWAVRRDIPDNQSGYRLLSARLAEAMLDSTEDGFEFEVEMIARCIRDGWGIGWVPIRTIYAGGPSHIRPWQHFTSFIRVVRAARRTVRADPK